jgi:hypothetical protein
MSHTSYLLEPRILRVQSPTSTRSWSYSCSHVIVASESATLFMLRVPVEHKLDRCWVTRLWVPKSRSGQSAEPRIKDQLVKETVEIARGAAQLLDLDVPVTSGDVVLNEDYVGEAYEKPTPEALEAIRLVAQTEGILLDPVCTGRSMAGLTDLVKQGRLKRDDNVVFFHTGGMPTLFPYRKELYEQS